MVRCAIWYHFYNLKNVKNAHGGVLQAEAKLTLLHGCFSRFLNCTNDTKSRSAIFAAAKISNPVTNLPKGGKNWFFYPFKPFSILNFAIAKCFFRGKGFVNVFLSLNFSLKQFYVIFIMKKIFYYVVHTSHQVRYWHFLIVWHYCWNCEFDRDIKIKQKCIIITMMENNK